MQQVYPGDVAAACAQHFQCGDAGAPGLEIGRHPAADPDPGNRQRGEADENEEFAHVLDEALGAGGCPVAGLVGEAGFGELLLQPVDRLVRVHAVAQRDPGLGAVHGPRRKQSGAAGKVLAHHGNRAHGEALAEPVGFVGDDAADCQALPADGDCAARGDC